MLKPRYKSQPSALQHQKSTDNFLKNQQNLKTQASQNVKLPKIKHPKLSQQEVDEIGRKVIKLKSLYYGPNGCSRSPAMQKILMLKKINRGQGSHSYQKQSQVVSNDREKDKEKDKRKIKLRSMFGGSKIRNKDAERERNLQRSLRYNITTPLTAQYYMSKIYM